ncbi:MAG: energy-coupling factor ABC transporter ATP-binding protein [Salinirussus sp.]
MTIALHDVTVEYNDTTALQDVSVTFDTDEWVLLSGRNGSGKTTLVRLCNGLLEPDKGTVTVDGVDPVAEPVRARTRVGMVFQSPRDGFVAATVGADVAFGPENLGLDRDEIDRRVDEALTAVGLADRADARIDALSGGEQARVAVAGALAMEPDYLVLDEPLAGLDWPARQGLLAHLDDLAAAGTAIVLVTHDVRDVVSRADRIIGLEDGRVAVNAPPQQAVETLDGIGVRVPE